MGQPFGTIHWPVPRVVTSSTSVEPSARRRYGSAATWSGPPRARRRPNALFATFLNDDITRISL
jgi:hypothetical protein